MFLVLKCCILILHFQIDMVLPLFVILARRVAISCLGIVVRFHLA